MQSPGLLVKANLPFVLFRSLGHRCRLVKPRRPDEVSGHHYCRTPNRGCAVATDRFREIGIASREETPKIVLPNSQRSQRINLGS